MTDDNISGWQKNVCELEKHKCEVKLSHSEGQEIPEGWQGVKIKVQKTKNKGLKGQNKVFASVYEKTFAFLWM